jgi:hypothetical protein
MEDNRLKLEKYKTAKSKKSVRYRKILKRKAEIEKAMKGCGGIISVIAERLKVDWVTVDKYLNSFPELKEKMKPECESVLDLAENKLIKSLKDGERWAIEFILRTKGKERGYYEKRAVENTNQDELAELKRKLKNII